MKAAFFTTFFLIFSRVALSQSPCAGGTVSPTVAQPTGATVVSTTCSTLLVKWQGSLGQSYCVYATYLNTGNNEKKTVAGAATCADNQICTATLPVIAGAQVTWSVQAILNGASSYPVINVLENAISRCSGSGVTLCGKVLLQGAYDTATKKMSNRLNSLGILQAQARLQPYNNTTFGYTGTEAVSTTFFATHPDIVDWVLIELREGNAPSSIVARRAAFVKQDGTLIDTNGTSKQIFFPAIPTASYHIAIRHRNHLGIRTLSPVDFSCGNTCYDFTTAGNKAFRSLSYTSGTQMGTVWVMRGGDANANKYTSYVGISNDENQILNLKLGGSFSKILGNVYAPEDLNLDGTIKWTGPNNEQTFLLNTALLGLLSNIFAEQF